jgi:hypothetical protein
MAWPTGSPRRLRPTMPATATSSGLARVTARS